MNPGRTDSPGTPKTGIAVVGMTCRLPGAASVDEFWRNLRDGVESIRQLTREEMLAAGASEEDLDDPKHVGAAAVFDGIDLFDADFFGINGREAEVMDPQHRIFLECAWEALEDAGYDPQQYSGAIGVFGGGIFDSYVNCNLVPGGAFDDKAGVLQSILANEKDYMTTRVSYKLNLRGPSYNVQTGCSTSLVAIHLACQNLLNFESDIALAGGIAIDVQRDRGYYYSEGSVYSRDGHIRAFDADATGTVFGNGVGIVVLKRLEDAIADGDTIHAVILGSATNNDGSHKVGFTAPSVTGQFNVISEALADAGVKPDTIGYLEAHGTGTSLGDPIEVEAMTKAFGPRVGREPFCAIGSVKTNVGHLDAAAGVSGLIKTVLSLERRLLPPSLNFTTPNPKIDFARSPFFVNAELREWKTGTRNGLPRRAGVSSFGMGGTNAHLVLEEAPALPATDAGRPWQLLVVSAKTPAALESATNRLMTHLETRSDQALADVAFTLQVGRQAFAHRRAVVCRDAADGVDALVSLDPRRVHSAHYKGEPCRVAFLFPGQGAQHVNMARELYQDEPVFRAELDACCEALRKLLGIELRDLLYPEAFADAGLRAEAAERLRDTEIAQPALFAVEYALARLWMSWGITPAACLGHSLGEYVAACIGGVFTLPDALALVAARGRLMQQLPSGAMTAVPLPAAEVERMLGAALALAAVNGPRLCVVSGPTDAVESFERAASARGVECARLQTSHAFHSAMMDPIVDTYRGLVARVKRSAPAVPFVSNVTGTWITAEQAVDPQYWAAHLRQAVRFADGVKALAAKGPFHLLEVGPGRTLGSLARQSAGASASIVSSLPHPQDDRSSQAVVLDALGQLWLIGAPVNWEGVYDGQQRRRVPLPTYPFERQRYWVDPKPVEPEPVEPPPNPLEKNPDIARWFYLPEWRQTPPPEFYAGGATVDASANWLLFIDDTNLSVDIVTQLASRIGAERLVTVAHGDRFHKSGARRYTINPRSREDYAHLFRQLDASGLLPDAIGHLWGIAESTEHDADAADRAQLLGFYSVLWTAQAALATRPPTAERGLAIKVVTAHVQEVTGHERLRPERATVLGPCRVISQEHPAIKCCTIDVAPESLRPTAVNVPLASHIVSELVAQAPDPLVAYRNGRRWSPFFEPVALPAPAVDALPLRERGVYLITGGLGAIGTALARYLARTVHARLVLINRSPMPPRPHWDRWLATHDERDPTSRRILTVRSIEALGAEVLLFTADVAERDEMAAVLEDATQQFGRINGVISAAGIAGAGSIGAKSRDAGLSVLAPIESIGAGDADAQFRPKVRGLFVLEEVLGNRPLDFCLVVSSLSAVLAGPGYSTYAAANMFMDAFVRRHNQRHPVRWTTVNWDAWSFAGRDSALAKVTITEEEGVDVFARVLAGAALGQIVVSTANVYARAAAAADPAREEPASAAEPERKRYARPATLESAFEDPRTPAEKTVADVWQQVLGIDRVGRNDNFFALGGHSLLAVQVAARLEEALHVEVPMRNVFDAATVADLAARIQMALVIAQPETALVGTDGADVEELEI